MPDGEGLIAGREAAGDGHPASTRRRGRPSGAGLVSVAARRAQRARVAVAALFFTNGALFAGVVPRYPEIKADLGLSNATFGASIAAFPLGALVAGLFAAALMRRHGSDRVAAFGVVLLAGALLLVGFVGRVAALAGVLFAAGGLDAVVDVAQNAQGLRVQRLYRRSVVNSFHAVWSIGAVTGGAIGALAAGRGVPVPVQLMVTSLLFAAVAGVAHRSLLHGPDRAAWPAADGRDRPAEDDHTALSPAAGRGRRRPVAWRAVAVLGVLAACGALVEDAAASWGALFLRSIGAVAATAGLAFVAFQAAMTLGRLLGDRVIDRFGERRVVRVGGAVTAAGMASALAWPTVATALLGYAAAGLGVATLVPAAMHAADELPGLAHGVGLTVVSWLLRVGFLVSPPAVGLVADAASLRVGLSTVVVSGLLAVVCGSVLVGHGARGA